MLMRHREGDVTADVTADVRADVTTDVKIEMDDICAESVADQEKIRNSISCTFLAIILESKKDVAFHFTPITGFHHSQFFQIKILSKDVFTSEVQINILDQRSRIISVFTIQHSSMFS